MEQESKGQKINIFYILRVFISYWPLLVLSCFIFVFFAFLYLKFSSRTYSVSSSILIKTDRMLPRSASTYVNVNDLMNQEKNLANEINFLSSSPLIKEVINDMNLYTSYYYKENRIPIGLNFGLNNIYNKSPFFVIIDKNIPQPINTLFYFRILNERRFVLFAENEQTFLYNFQDETDSEESYYFSIVGEFEFGEIIQNEHCSFKILLNSNYSPETYQGKDLFFRFNSPQQLAYLFQKKFSINSNFYESSIAKLTFEGENLNLAKEFLNNLIGKYIDSNLEKKNLEANKTLEYIEQQLANISGTLGQSEQQLQNFRVSRDVMNIDDKSRNLYNQIQELETEQNELQSRLQNLNSLKSYFDENENSQTFIAPTITGMSDATLTTLIQELTELSRERQNLISTNQLKNPKIKTLEVNIASVIKVIRDNIDFNQTTTNNELNEVNNKLNGLNREYSRLPQTQRQLLELEREFNINDEVYTNLLDRRIQAKIIKASNRPDVEIIEPVHYNEVTSPSPMKVGVIFLFLGFFFPSIYIIAANFLSNKIKTKEDLSNYCSIQEIGEIPHISKNEQNVIMNSNKYHVVERFHALRSNIIYYLLGNLNQTLLITSTLPGEGKSFTSLNLALSFASANYKTLLIAFDLRKNSHTFDELKANTLVGLDSFLINKANIEDIISNTQYENLDFISNIQIPPNPAALLASPKIKELLEVVKTYYQYVIIDTPPFGLVSDAFTLMQHVDLSLYLVRLGTVTKKALKQNMEDINTKTNNTYLVVNDLTKLDKPYYGKYSYGETKKKNFWDILKFKRS